MKPHHFDPSTHDLWDATCAGEANPSAVTLPNARGQDAPGDVQGLYEFIMILPGGIIYHWIGLRESLQETMVFTIKYRAFL